MYVCMYLCACHLCIHKFRYASVEKWTTLHIHIYIHTYISINGMGKWTCGMDTNPRDLALVIVETETFLRAVTKHSRWHTYIHTYIHTQTSGEVVVGIDRSDYNNNGQANNKEHLIFSRAEICLPQLCEYWMKSVCMCLCMYVRMYNTVKKSTLTDLSAEAVNARAQSWEISASAVEWMWKGSTNDTAVICEK